MNNIIYIGSTNEISKFHVGMTHNNRSPELRWRQDDDYRGKMPYVPQRVAFYSVGDLRDEPIHNYILKDENVYRVKDEEGIRSPEIFRVAADNPADYLQSLVEEAIQYYETGLRPVDKFFSPRPHQAWVNAQVLDKFDGSKTVVQPLNLAARFGKTLQGLDLFKQSGLQTMVMAGYWLAANNSFVSTIEDRFDITSDITIIKPDYQEYVSALSTGNRVFIDLSLHTAADKIDDRLIAELAKTGSFIYVDEADFGAWTESSKATLNKFADAGNNLVVIATGTNIDRALIGLKDEFEYPITVSYLDLIEAKRGEGVLFDCQPAGPKETAIITSIRENTDQWLKGLENIVEVACVNLDASSALVDSQNALEDTERANMGKVFSKRNAHINRLITQVLFDDDNNEDVFGLYETRFGAIDHPAVMLFMSGTKADVNNLVKVGQRVAPHYNWIALHGDEYTNRTAEDMVKQTIASGGERTVIVSCSMGARSFSVPNIVSVVNAVDGGSLGTAVQRASRCLTPGCGKEVGLVVNYSFNTDRSSSFEADLISSVLRYDYEDTESAMRRVYGLANFLKKDEYGELITLTESEFTEYVTCPENLENMAAATVDFSGLFSIENLAELLAGVAPESMSKEWTAAIEKAITYIKKERDSERSVNDEKKVIRDLIRKINQVIHTTGNVFRLSPTSKSFSDAMLNISADPHKSQSYTDLVGVSPAVVLHDLMPYLPQRMLDLVLCRAASGGFAPSQPPTATHAVGLFSDVFA